MWKCSYEPLQQKVLCKCFIVVIGNCSFPVQYECTQNLVTVAVSEFGGECHCSLLANMQKGVGVNLEFPLVIQPVEIPNLLNNFEWR